jgi:CrcB protein
MASYFWVALGGALGSMARYWMTGFVAAVTGSLFPWGTIVVNILGSFVIGFFAGVAGPYGRFATGQDAQLFVMVGICGGFTTFSAFSLQTLYLARTGNWLQAGANILLSVVLCLVAVALGHLLAVAVNGSQE